MAQVVIGAAFLVWERTAEGLVYGACELNRAFKLVLSLTGLSATFAMADEYSEQWGPTVGSELIVLEAYDQSGQLRTLTNLTGERGLLLFLNRSADW
jgi:hypothetical protein